MKYAALIVALVLGLAACTLPSLNPFEWGGGTPSGGGGGDPEPDPDSVTGQVSIWMNLLIRFGWFGIVLMFVVPGVRTPFIALWTGIFHFLAIPFELARLKWDEYEAKKRESSSE